MWNDENKPNPSIGGEPSGSGSPGEAAAPGPGVPEELAPRPSVAANLDAAPQISASERDAVCAGLPPSTASNDLFAPPSAEPLRSEDLIEAEHDSPSNAAKILARAAARRRRLSAMQRPDTREVILAWCLWLLITWVLLGFGASPAAIRWMVFLSAGGLIMLWPVFRLSQDGFIETSLDTVDPMASGGPTSPESDTRNTATFDPAAGASASQPRSALTPGLILRDWLGMNIIFQAVVWPQIITNRWHADQAMFVSIAVAAWSLLVAALVAWGCQRRLASIRTWVMVSILLVVWGEPLLMLGIRAVLPNWAAAFAWTMHISPIEAIYALTEPATTFEPEPWRPTLIAVLVAASVAWIGVARKRK